MNIKEGINEKIVKHDMVGMENSRWLRRLIVNNLPKS